MVGSSVARADRRPKLIFSCEHGGNKIPAPYKTYFKGAAAALATHRGLDIGALVVVKQLAKDFRAPLHFATVSRLLCDLNRSVGHKRLFSEWSGKLDAEGRDEVLAKYYRPYRDAVEQEIARHVSRGQPVLHLSIHSFTPRLNGETRNCEIGLLYDPRRASEARGADLLHDGFRKVETTFRIRRNYPYTGVSDGFQGYLRKQFSQRLYTGIEIEMNQGVVETANGRAEMRVDLALAISSAFGYELQ